MTHALIVVDVQNDFCEGGSLGVDGGTAVATSVAELIRTSGGEAAGADRRYDHVVATRDHHIDPGEHFSDTPDYVTSWPPHCVVGTPGAELHPALEGIAFDAVFDKGEYTAAYSGFEGAADGVPLQQWLRDHDVDSVDIVGIATDHCVRATALDAKAAGLQTQVLLELTAGVAPETTLTALDTLRDAGVVVSGPTTS